MFSLEAEKRSVTVTIAGIRLEPLHFVESVADWVLLIALIAASLSATGDLSLAAWVVVARFVPRLVILLAGDRLVPPGAGVIAAARLARAGAAAVLAGYVVVANRPLVAEPGLLIAGALIIGAFATVGSESWTESVATLGSDTDRIAWILGPAAAWVILYFAPVQIALGLAALLLAADAVIALRLPTSAAPDTSPPATIQHAPAPWRRLAPYVAAAFGSGAIVGSLLIGLLPQVGYAAVLGLWIAIIATSGLWGPLNVPRLLLRAPAALLLLGLALLAGAAAFVGAWAPWIVVALGALLVLGLGSVTLDSLRAIALRRLAPAGGYGSAVRASSIALATGQVVGAGAMALAAPSVGTVGVVLAVAVGQVVLVAVAVAVNARESLVVGGLSTLPIKSVVHKLSWEMVPDPRPADFTKAQGRLARLADWIEGTVDMQELHVTLPVSKRQYTIYRPTDDSREELFAQGRADPDKQMPYWAKTWPSGVALADVVVERADQVRGKHLVELGAGLGVTADAVLEAGGSLVTADYSLLPLAFCRLNTLTNTGKAARAICFNWRHQEEADDAMQQPALRDGFPLMLGADLLYEGRDAEPLLNVVERLLSADGELWLAEPVRKTAQRFLDSAAALGWDIKSRQVQADWPDATNGPVNLHFLKRSREPDRISADLGGWRI